jgi:glycosyltransferase involved in cell wall biosynthesis
MRVTHVLWNGGIGGIERQVHDLALVQREQGIEVRVAFGQAVGPFADAMRAGGIPVVDLALRSGYDLRPNVVARGRSALAQSDVLHVHGWNLPLFLLTRGRPLVATEHGTLGLGRRRTLPVRAKRLLQRAALSRAAVVTTPSNYMVDVLARTLRVPRERVRVVPNGIAPGDPRVAQPRGDELVVAVVGRLAAVKRIDRALNAFAQIPHDLRARLLIAGSGPLDGELRALAAAREIEDRVTFLGPVADVAALLGGVDALVLPTSGEPFGLVVVEAAAAGALPIVFADAGGALEILPPDGVVVADERELAAALAKLPESPWLGPDARRARSEWAHETFPIGTTARLYREAYDEVLARLDRPGG